MKTATIKTSLEIFIECPHCGNWEDIHSDEQRHHLNYFEIVEWLPEVSAIEQYKMKCLDCEKEFKLNWNYEQ